MLVTYAEAKSLQDDANEKKASKSYEAAADLFEKAAEKFMLCGLETEAKGCDQGKDAVLSQLALLEQANILCDEAETVGRNGVEQCKIASIQEAVTLLTAAINIFTKVGAPEGIAEALKQASGSGVLHGFITPEQVVRDDTGFRLMDASCLPRGVITRSISRILSNSMNPCLETLRGGVEVASAVSQAAR